MRASCIRAEFILELDLFMWLCHDRLIIITQRFLTSLICLRVVCPICRLLAMSAGTFFSCDRDNLSFCRIYCQMVLYHPKLEGHQVRLDHSKCTLLVVQLV